MQAVAGAHFKPFASLIRSRPVSTTPCACRRNASPVRLRRFQLIAVLAIGRPDLCAATLHRDLAIVNTLLVARLVAEPLLECLLRRRSHRLRNRRHGRARSIFRMG
jgi:hypothetical protein